MSDRLSARISPAIARLVECAAPSNESAATKALLILGAAQAGFDLSELRRDIALLLAEDLDPAVESALRSLSAMRQTHGVQVSNSYEMPPQVPPTEQAEESEAKDPFDVGWDV